MILDEAIKHAEEVAEEKQKTADIFRNLKSFNNPKSTTKHSYDICLECAEEHRQLAEWLKELKDYRERIPSYEAGHNDAKREIALSGEYERAYERGKLDAEQTKWIPVSERLPENRGFYLVSTDCITIMEFCNGWISQNIGLCNWYVQAWMPLPQPYKAESGGTE